MTLEDSEREKFLVMLQGAWDEMPLENDPMASYRHKAWEQFRALGLPSRSLERYRYIKWRQLYLNHFDLIKSNLKDQLQGVLPECKESLIVLVNGVYDPRLSSVKNIPSKVIIAPLKDAMRTYGAYLSNSWNKMLIEEKDSLALLNAALHTEALFVYVPPKTVIENPIQILNIITSDKALLVMPRIQFFVGAQSEISLIASQNISNNDKTLVNQVIEISLDEAARATYVSHLCEEREGDWHFDALRGSLKKNAALKTVKVTQGSATVRQDYRIALTGENAEALLNGLWMLDDHREAHTHIMIDHQAPNCRSYQLFKGVLAGSSRSSFEGKIMVRKEAQKTEAFQMNPNILVSDQAHADSAPNLEIFADDVKASHGATVGQLDQDQLFYMRTRGIKADDAMHILVRGFCTEVLDKMPLESLRSLK